MRNLWPGARSVAVWLTLLIIAASTIIRFVHLEDAPKGFFIDEADCAVHILCLSETGHDGNGIKTPLFSQGGGGGIFSPVHLYLGVVWTKIFGPSIYSIRAMAAFMTTIAMLGLFFLAQNLMDQRAALFVVLAACVSPWAFPFARQSMDDPTLFPLGLIWGTYYFLRSQRLRDAFLAGLFYSIAFYAYSPSRIQIPLFGLALIYYKSRRRSLSLPFQLTFVVTGIILCFPLIRLTLSGETLVRYNVVGIFSPWYRHRLGTDTVWGAISVFVKNYALHFNPKFLFVSGDGNLRHSTQFSGELSWLDDFALLTGIVLFAKIFWQRRKESGNRFKNLWARVRGRSQDPFFYLNGTFVLFLIGYLAGLIPPALTWEGLPHALRAVGCWPFVCLMTGFIIWKAESQIKFYLPTAVTIAAVFGTLYMIDYFTVYPRISAAWFDSTVKEGALAAEATNQWPVFMEKFKTYGSGPMTKRYYLMRYGHRSCDESAAQP